MMHEWKVTQQRYGRLLRQRIRRLMRRREKILADLAKARGGGGAREVGGGRGGGGGVGGAPPEGGTPPGPPPAYRTRPRRGDRPRLLRRGRPAPHDCPRPGPLG